MVERSGTDLHEQATQEARSDDFERRLAYGDQDVPPNPFTVADRLLFACEKHSTDTGKDLRDTIMSALVPLCRIRSNRDLIATEIRRLGSNPVD